MQARTKACGHLFWSLKWETWPPWLYCPSRTAQRGLLCCKHTAWDKPILTLISHVRGSQSNIGFPSVSKHSLYRRGSKQVLTCEAWGGNGLSVCWMHVLSVMDGWARDCTEALCVCVYGCKITKRTVVDMSNSGTTKNYLRKRQEERRAKWACTGLNKCVCSELHWE